MLVMNTEGAVSMSERSGQRDPKAAGGVLRPVACASLLALAAPAAWAQSGAVGGPGAQGLPVPPLSAQASPAVSARSAASAARQPMALSFAQAAALQREGSPLLAGRDEAVRAGEAGARAVRHVGGPIVSLSANWLRYQKSLSVDLASARGDVQNRIDDFLGTLPSQFPPALQPAVGQAGSLVSGALPGLLGALPDQLNYTARQSVFRPSLTAVWPFYTGGADAAVRKGAEAQVALAQAARSGAASLSQLDLARAYFGQQAALQLLATNEAQLAALQAHAHNAERMVAAGVLPRSRMLEVGVARDAAQRGVDRARLQLTNAQDDLSRLLDVPGSVAPTTPLFVRAEPLPPLELFLESGAAQRPEVRAAEAARVGASAARDLAAASLKPNAFLYGTYNFNRRHAVPIDPDWMVGIGVQFTLVSNIDRRDMLQAAESRERAADRARQAAERDARQQITRAWNQTELARQTFLSLDSSLVAARENLRVQQLSFREGVGTATDVITAQSALSLAEAQRVAAALEYDLSLAALLAASSRDDEFTQHMAQAEYRLAPASAGSLP